MFCGHSVRVLWNPFFFVLSLISRSLSWFSCSIMLSLTFYFHCAYFSWLYKCLIGRLFDRRPDKLLSRTLYGIRVTAQYAKKMPRIMHNLHHYQIASKLTGISNKTISRIKADSENAVLGSHEETGWCFSDFDKCEICINCKIIHNKQDNKLL